MLKPIEKIDTTTYKVGLEKDEVEIGDKRKTDFKPHIKLKRWGEECFINLELETTKELTPKEEKELGEIKKVKWVTTDQEIRFYPLDASEQMDEGGFEYDILLKRNPTSNKIRLKLEAGGLKFFYQPPLTQREIDDGAFRPENVVGSYAVYHATKKPWHRSKEEADKYKGGKAFHIYRPKIKDVDGNEIWGELDVNIVKNTLTITIDQNFLDNAVYPVNVDPTFGYTSIGGSNGNFSAGYILLAGDTYSPSSNGTGDSMSMYIGSTGNVIKLAVYDSSDESLIDSTGDITVTAGPAWFSGDFSGSPSLSSSTNYRLVYTYDVSTTVYYDSTTPNDKYAIHTYADAFPDPGSWSNTTFTRKYSIYCTYTTGAGVHERLVQDIEGVADSISREGTKQRSLTDTQGITDSVLPATPYDRTLTGDLMFPNDVLPTYYSFISRSLTDNMGMTDSVSTTWLYPRTVSDTMGMTDSISREHTTVEVPSKTILSYEIDNKLALAIAGISTLLEQADIIVSEDLSSQANGSNTVFTTSNKYVTDTLEITINGARQMKGASNDFTETTTTTFTFNFAPLGGDIIQVDYFKSP